MRTVAELIDALTEMVGKDPQLADAIVMFAHQPRYPLQCGIDGPVASTESADRDPDEPVVVYLLEGSWRPRAADGSEISPYASRDLWSLV